MSEQCSLHDICFNEIKENLLNTNRSLNQLIEKFEEWSRQTAVQQTLIEQLYNKVNEIEEKFDIQKHEFMKLDKQVAIIASTISLITSIIFLLISKKIGL